jgi:CRISPR-associated protein Csx3
MIATGAYDNDSDWSKAMVNLLPAILIGGPPNAGKSVLFYSLTKTLHEGGVRHHAIRACPDGEGNWYQEIHRELDPETIRVLRIKKAWSDSFVQGICRDLEGRHLPLLVDMGGRPRENQMRILQACTHSLLLLRRDEPESIDTWCALANRAGLLPLAEIFSERDSVSTIISETPVLTGILANLERGIPAQGVLFDALVKRIAALFTSYSLEDLEQAKLALAPAECTINLDPLLRKLDPQAQAWTPEMLKQLSGELPGHTDLAVYGRGPGWLYGMLAASAGQHSFYQFDPRIGWLAPPVLNINEKPSSDEITVHVREYQDAFILTTRINTDYLDHLQAEQLAFPPVPASRGVIIDGKIPHWLLTALVQLYNKAGVAWIACHQPTLKGAVVIASRSVAREIGELIPLPVFEPLP